MMTIREAHRMGYRTVAWDPDPDCPSSRLADEMITASFSDPDAARKLASLSDVVTYEFENVDPAAVEIVEGLKPVFPGSAILKIARHRKNEKESLARAGFPVVPFLAVRDESGLRKAVERLGLPVVVKTVTAGYDGKGQSVLSNQTDLTTWCRGIQGHFPDCIVERFLTLQCEVSVIAVRGADGSVTAFPVIENEHRENVLHVSRVPARIPDGLRDQALRLGREVITHFNMVGVLCVEMFVTAEGTLLVNELAPRPHNSGHFSLDACSVSQFEALVRSVCGLTMHAPRLLTPCAMVNLLGKHLERIDLVRAARVPGAKVHVYGKKKLEPRRKMGHVTILRSSERELDEAVAELESMIGEDKRIAGSASAKQPVSAM